MALFKRSRDGSRLTFNCVGLSEKQFTQITKLVEENGGAIGECELPIIFTTKSEYEKKEHGHSLPFRLYDIEFIRTCAQRGKIVDMRPYRLGPKKLGETDIISVFIHGEGGRMEEHEESPNGENSLSSRLSPPICPVPKSTKSKQSSRDECPAELRAVKLSESLQKSSEQHLDQIPASSQESFYTADDEILIKAESDESSGWEPDPRLHKKKVFLKSKSDLGLLSSTTVYQQFPENASTNGDRSPSPKKQNPSAHVPRLKVLNVSQLMRRSNSAEPSQIVRNPVASKKDSLPKITTAVPLTVELFTGKSPNPEAGSQRRRYSQGIDENTSIPSNTSMTGRKLGVRREKRTVPQPSKAPESIHTSGNLSPNRTTQSDEALSPIPGDPLEPESGPWIAPHDAWMEKQSNSRMYPTAEYIQRPDGSAPLLRANFHPESDEIRDVSTRPDPRQRPADNDSSTCDEEELDPLATSTKTQKQVATRKNVEKVQKSPATLKSKESPRISQKKVANLKDVRKVQEAQPILISKEIKKRKIAARERTTVEACDSAGIIISDSNDEEVETRVNGTSKSPRKGTATTMKKKTVTNRTETSAFDDPQPGPSGLSKRYRTQIQNDSDTDEDEVANTRQRPNSQAPGNKEIGGTSWDVAELLSSSDDEEPISPAKRSKNNEEVQRKKKKLQHPAFDSDTEEDEALNPQIEYSDSSVVSDKSHVSGSGDDSETDLTADNNGIYIPRRFTRKKQQYRKEGKWDNRKALKYAAHWRRGLESERNIKGEVTRMKFTKEEQRTMVKFLCTFPDIERVQPKGFKIWIEMLNRGLLLHRTSQSLQNHFTKCLLPRIQDFFKGMSEEHQRQFKRLQLPTGRKYL